MKFDVLIISIGASGMATLITMFSLRLPTPLLLMGPRRVTQKLIACVTLNKVLYKNAFLCWKGQIYLKFENIQWGTIAPQLEQLIYYIFLDDFSIAMHL